MISRTEFNESRLLILKQQQEPSKMYDPTLATSRLTNIFGNRTIYRHEKKLKRAKTPEINRINRAPKARASFEVPKDAGTNRKKYLNRAKDFAKV